MIMEKKFSKQIEDGERFGFGKNWAAFLKTLDETKIKYSIDSLKQMLELESLKEKTFIDVGSASGLSSLAAYKLGAEVLSFDFDDQSVACTKYLRDRYAQQEKEKWEVMQGSVLDKDFIKKMGTFNIVYSWGVLHHTGNMYEAFENVILLCKKNSLLFIAIYDDRGLKSRGWKIVKKIYNKNSFNKGLVKSVFFPYFVLTGLVGDISKLKNPVKRYTEYKSNRGMSVYHDWVDWLGGYPFEVATPTALKDFFKARGFTLLKGNYVPAACNELIFKKL